MNILSVPIAPLEVVIPSRNRNKMICNALASLEAAAKYASYYLKVKVVDDASKKPYKLNVTVYHNLYLHIIRLNDCKGAGGARNAGIGKTKTDWVAIIDDDCIVEQKWLFRAIELIRQQKVPNLAIIGGDVIPWKCRSICGKYLSAIKHLSGPLHDDRGIIGLTTANMLIQKAAFLEIGGFDDSFLNSEDTDLIIRIRNQYKVRYDPELFLYHCHDIELYDFAIKFFRYGRSLRRVLDKNSLIINDVGVYNFYCSSCGSIVISYLKALAQACREWNANHPKNIGYFFFLAGYVLSISRRLALEIGFCCGPRDFSNVSKKA